MEPGVCRDKFNKRKIGQTSKRGELQNLLGNVLGKVRNEMLYPLLLLQQKTPSNNRFLNTLVNPGKLATLNSIKQPHNFSPSPATILSFPGSYLILSDWFECCTEPWGYNCPFTHLRWVL